MRPKYYGQQVPYKNFYFSRNRISIDDMPYTSDKSRVYESYDIISYSSTDSGIYDSYWQHHSNDEKERTGQLLYEFTIQRDREETHIQRNQISLPEILSEMGGFLVCLISFGHIIFFIFARPSQYLREIKRKADILSRIQNTNFSQGLVMNSRN